MVPPPGLEPQKTKCVTLSQRGSNSSNLGTNDADSGSNKIEATEDTVLPRRLDAVKDTDFGACASEYRDSTKKPTLSDLLQTVTDCQSLPQHLRTAILALLDTIKPGGRSDA